VASHCHSSSDLLVVCLHCFSADICQSGHGVCVPAGWSEHPFVLASEGGSSVFGFPYPPGKAFLSGYPPGRLKKTPHISWSFCLTYNTIFRTFNPPKVSSYPFHSALLTLLLWRLFRFSKRRLSMGPAHWPWCIRQEKSKLKKSLTSLRLCKLAVCGINIDAEQVNFCITSGSTEADLMWKP